jgi:hypothetical protein
VLLIAALATVLFLFNPSQYGFYPRCALYTTTGIYCPGCGSLRAMHQLAHGHLATAMRCNPLLILSLPFAAFYFWRFFGRWMAGDPLPPLVISQGWIKLLTVVVILFTILRNIPYAPFIYLAPP